jgi:hypothetical protein
VGAGKNEMIRVKACRRYVKATAGAFTVSIIALASRCASASDTTSLYPELPIAKNYLHVAKVSVDAWNKKFKLPAAQKAAALEFVFHRMSVREFEKLMLQDEKTLKKGHKDLSIRKTEEYRREYDQCDYVSGHMAVLEVRNALYVYERKVLKPDALRRALFAANPGRENETRISCIEQRTSVAEFKQDTGSKFPVRAGDAIYLYGNAYGKGYLVVRNNKIVKDEPWVEY